VARDVSARVRAEVANRAGHRCEYCLIHEDDAGFPHQVDHVVSRKHGGTSVSLNLAYSCVLCNRHKGTDIASIDQKTGELVPLFHPRRERWSDHFFLDGDLIQPRSEIGAVTVRLLLLNSPERVAERQLLHSLGRYPRR